MLSAAELGSAHTTNINTFTARTDAVIWKLDGVRCKVTVCQCLLISKYSFWIVFITVTYDASRKDFSHGTTNFSTLHLIGKAVQRNIENLKESSFALQFSFTLKMLLAREGKPLLKSEESLEKIARGCPGRLW